MFLQGTWTVRITQGDRGSTVVKVLCYKSEGRWLEFFINIKSFMTLGSTQPLTEMSTGSISWG